MEIVGANMKNYLLKKKYNQLLNEFYDAEKYLNSNVSYEDKEKYINEYEKIIHNLNYLLELIPHEKENISNGFKI